MLLYTLAVTLCCAAEIVWPLEQHSGVARPEEFTLENFAAPGQNVPALIDRQYRPEWDMNEHAWTLTGTFRTAANGDATQYLVGNRSQRSGYTGWNLLLRNGKLQLMVIRDKQTGKTLTSNARYDDQKEHRFELSYHPGQIRLQVDGVKVLESSVSPTGIDERRRFAVGSLSENGKALLPFSGALRDFHLTTGAPSAADATKLDPELRMNESASRKEQQPWIDVLEACPGIVRGRGWDDAVEYRRFPERMATKVRKEVWALSTHSAGLYLHFKLTGARPLGIRWTLTSNNYLPHMSPIGVNGLDVYTRVDGKWQWLTSGRPSRLEEVNVQESLLYTPPDRPAEYMIYLPLYTGVRKLELLLPESVMPEPVKPTGATLVFYGTSITHGCSASRPGMTYPAILGRRLDLPVVNLGFSGNGTMDPEFAEILAEIPASAYIIDCLPNMTKMTGDEVLRRARHLVTELRRRRPDTPIVLVEDRPYANSRYRREPRIQPHWESFRKFFDELRNEGFDRLYYVRGENLIGRDNEATVDGSHPTDLGMMRYADALEPVLKEALQRKQ